MDIKILSFTLTQEEAESISAARKQVVTSTGIWQIDFSAGAMCYYAWKVVNVKGLAKRGHYFTATPVEVDRLLHPVKA